jgi:hypothetical protein
VITCCAILVTIFATAMNGTQQAVHADQASVDPNPRKCLARFEFNSIEPAGESLLIFRGHADNYWLNRLPKPCLGMGPRSGINGPNNGNSVVCKGDLFESAGNRACVLGSFEKISAKLLDLMRHPKESPIAARFPSARITVEEWREFELDVESKAAIECRELAANQRQCDSVTEMTIWIFTREGHPAHPAVSRGTIIVAPGKIGIDRTGHFAGDPNAFDAWMAALHQFDQQQLDQWRNHK